MAISHSKQIQYSRLLIPLLGCLVAFGPLSVDTYLPSLPEIARDLGSDQSTIQKTITSFLLGVAVGMLVFGPLSDLLGRKKLLIFGTLFYSLASIGCAFAPDGESLILLRLLQSVGAASAAVISRTLVRDLFDTERAAGILSSMHIISMVVMLLAPILGAYIVFLFNWQWIFYFLATFSFIAFIGVIFLIDEPKIAQRQAFRLKNYLKAYQTCFASRAAIFFVLANGFTFGGMFAYIAASAFVYIEFFNLSETTYGFIFSSNIGAIILITVINKKLLKSHNSQFALKFCFSILALSIMVLLLASFTNSMVWIMISTMLYISVTGAVGANCLATIFKTVPSVAGTGAGLLVANQFAMGSLFSFLMTLFFEGNPIALLWTMSVSGVLAILSFLAGKQSLGKQ